MIVYSVSSRYVSDASLNRLTPAASWSLLLRDVGEDLRELHAQHLIAGHLQLATEEQFHRIGVRVFQERLEVSFRQAYSAVRFASAGRA